MTLPPPLAGRRVVVTRARHQARGLIERLEAAGATVVEVPTIDVADPRDGGAALAEAAEAVDRGEHEWVAFTSANAARRFLPLLRSPGRSRVAAVGPGTAAVVESLGARCELVAEQAIAEELVGAFPSGPGRVLVPQAEAARDALAEGLRAKGWTVTTVVAYRTVALSVSAAAAAAARAADAIAFTSASTVESFVGGAGLAALAPVVACIGPRTADAARARGVEVTVVADDHTLDGVVAALLSVL